MNEDDVRAKSSEVGEALVAGDVERVIATFSDELKRNLGEVLALLPLPATATAVESVDRGGSGYGAVLRIVGESDEVKVQLRWKERDGEPRIVEVSHLSRAERAPEEVGPGSEGEDASPQAGTEDGPSAA